MNPIQNTIGNLGCASHSFKFQVEDGFNLLDFTVLNCTQIFTPGNPTSSEIQRGV